MKPNILLFAFLFLYFCETKKLDAENVIIAINSGSSSEFQGFQGFQYQSDRGFSKSRDVDYQTNEQFDNLNIIYSYDQAVYKTERHYDATFSYELDLPTEGNYVLILKFCERLFNIKLGDKQVVKNLDIVKQVGSQAAYDEYIEFEFKNNQISNKKEGICKNAYDNTTKKLRIDIEKGEKDLPLINGLILYKGKLEDTDYSEQEALRADWKAALEESKRIEQEEKKRKYEAKKKLLKNVRDYEFNVQIINSLYFLRRLRKNTELQDQ